MLTARFADGHRLFTNDQGAHYLAVLNPAALDMFVLLFVDENTDSAVRTDNFIIRRTHRLPCLWPSSVGLVPETLCCQLKVYLGDETPGENSIADVRALARR